MNAKNHDRKKILLSFLSLALITSLAACGSGTNGKATTFTLKGAGAGGDTSAGAKAAYSKNKCINKLQDGDNQSFVDPAGTQSAKICQLSGDPKAPYAINAITRKFTYSKSSAKKGSPVVGITLNVGLDIVSRNVSLTPDHKEALRQEIIADCDAEMVSIWRKSGITLKVNYAVGTANADQILALDSSISSTDSTAQDGTTPSDELVTFDIWPDLKAPLSPANAKACADKFPDSSTSGGPRDTKATQRAACVREANQPFCLALNKLVGNWLGVEDKSDLNCHPTDSIANDPKAPRQSFVTYKVTPDPGTRNPVIPPVALAVPVKTTADTTTASNIDTTSSMSDDADPDHSAQMAAFEVQSKAILAGLVRAQSTGATATTPATQNPVRPATAQPRRRIGQSSDDGSATTTPAPKDDALYGSYWSPWTVLDSDVSQILCGTAPAPSAATSTDPNSTTPATPTTPASAAPSTTAPAAPAADPSANPAPATTSAGSTSAPAPVAPIDATANPVAPIDATPQTPTAQVVTPDTSSPAAAKP